MAANGVTRYGLSHHAIKSAFFPVPPLSEQVAIVEYLDKATADIDTAIDRTHREIELIREYRERLIADVVTGKLDVREAAAKLAKDGKIELASHRQTDDSANFETGMSGRFQLGDAKPGAGQIASETIEHAIDQQ